MEAAEDLWAFGTTPWVDGRVRLQPSLHVSIRYRYGLFLRLGTNQNPENKNRHWRAKSEVAALVHFRMPLKNVE